LLRCNAASMTPIGNARMSDNHTDIARRNMVDSQILPNKVTDERIIDAMSDLPREKFLPNARRALAYADESVLIEDGRYMMQPMVLARLLETADLQPGNVALAIGCASGYGVAVLAKLADTVVAIEPDPGMRAKAERTLGELGIDNVAIVDGDLHEGHPTQAPFDVIYFDAFGARVQPELWTEEIFLKMFLALKSRGVLVTYAAKGSARRAMQSVGFSVERLPGPPGKREMLRAVKL